MNNDTDKMYTYIKGFAMGSGNMPETIKALAIAREMHKEQKRKNGEPYIIHPLKMACHAIAMGIYDDVIIASLLLHDVPEDCNVTAESLGMNTEITQVIKLLTFICPDKKSKETYKKIYYAKISENMPASVCKCIDRGHNVSSMAGVFSVEKLNEYIDETRVYVLPLLRVIKDKWPEMSSIVFILKYHIMSVIDAIQATLNLILELKNKE